MKNFLLTIALTWPLFSLAQEYVTFPTQNTVWAEYFYAGEIALANVYHYFALKENDTIINGSEYHKLYCSFDTTFTENELCGGLREENKRIYYYSINNLNKEIINSPIPANYEVLLYDFNLQPGDTITNEIFRLRHIDKLIVANLDSIFIENKYRKRYSFKTEYGSLIQMEHWVEGIGCLRGLLSDIGAIPTSDWNSWLICMISEDNVFYHDPQFIDCYNSNQTSVQILVNQSDIRIFPNPAKSNCQVEFRNHNYNKLITYSTEGQQLREYNISGFETISIERENLPTGTYILSFYDEAGNIETRKVIFQ